MNSMNSANARCLPFFSRGISSLSPFSFLFVFSILEVLVFFLVFAILNAAFSLFLLWVLMFSPFVLLFFTFPCFLHLVCAFGADFLYSFSFFSGVNCLCGLVVRTLHSGVEEARVRSPVGAFPFHFLFPSFGTVGSCLSLLFVFHCGLL